jgi:hypothetical protein
MNDLVQVIKCGVIKYGVMLSKNSLILPENITEEQFSEILKW